MKFSNLTASLVMTALIAAVTGCASTGPEVTVAEPPQTETPVADEAARAVDSNYFVDIEFDKGSDALTEPSRSSLTSLLKRARAEGPLADVKVLVWADEEYPSAKLKKLSRSQRKLAAARGRSLAIFIKSLDQTLPVESHNMAQRPSAISRWFNTPDARFKRSLVAAGLPTTAEDEPITGRASHAVILVTMKQ